MEKTKVPRYSLHIDCHFRLSSGNTILLSRGDIFQPSYTVNRSGDFAYDSFQWDVKGQNRYDEITQEIRMNQGAGLFVEKVVVNLLGDIKCHFSNGFLLEVCPDISGNEECWRFFEQKSQEHLVVSGKGIETESFSEEDD